jgi:hypothetical protein
MRISKLTRWIIAIVLISGALIWLGINLIQERNTQQQLNMSITETSQQLNLFTQQHSVKINELESQKKEVQDEINAYSSPIPNLINQFGTPGKYIEIDEVLYEDAYNSNVQIISITVSQPARVEHKEEIETKDGGSEKKLLLTYQSTSVQVVTEGEVVALLNFIDRVNDRFPSFRIKQVAIKVPEPVEAEGTEEDEEKIVEESEKEPSLTLSLELYSYERENG